MVADTLITHYRPQSFDEVVGQGAVVRALHSLTESGDTQAYLFSGPAGTGKTTLARITAAAVGCAPEDILEIPAAVYTGVDDMRAVVNGTQYRPLGGSLAKAIILDEAHRLSKQAWDSLLKAIEEPPAYTFWFLCTTMPDKVPTTIRTRCAAFTLKPVREDDLGKLVDRVAIAERIDLPDEVFDLIVREARGSPRQALVNLALCRDITDRKAAAAVLATALESDTTIELCRLIVQRGSWAKAMALVGQLDESPEGTRRIVQNYLGKALMNAKSDEAAISLLDLLDAFRHPYPDEEPAHLLVSIGRALYAAPS